MKRSIVALLLVLCGCAQQASWLRADGIPSTPDAARLAEAQCKSEHPVHNFLGITTVREIERCMAQHGYIAVQ